MNQPSTAPARTSLLGMFVQQLLLLQLFLSPLVFNRSSLEVFEYNKVALLQTTALLLVGLGLAAFGWSSWQAASVGLRPPLVLGFLLFVVSAGCSTWWSMQPRTSVWGTFESFSGLWTVLAYLVLFLATLFAVQGPTAMRRLLAGSVAASALLASYALVQAVGWDALPWVEVSRVGGLARPFATMGHGNFLSGYLVAVLPLSGYFAWLSWRERQWGAVGVLLLVQMLSVVIIVLSLSRGAWVALGCVAVVLAVGWAGSQRQRWLRLGLGVLLAAGCLGGGFWLLGHRETGLLAGIRTRAGQLGEAGTRRLLWQASLAMFQERPWLGWGLDTYPLAFGKFRPAELWTAESNMTPIKAHNEFLHVLATQGLLGGLAVLTLLAGLMQATWRAWQRATTTERPLVLALTASAVGFLVQVSFSFSVAGCGTLFVTVCALLARLAWPGAALPVTALPARKLHRVCLLAACLLVGLLFWYNLDPQGPRQSLAWAGAAAMAMCLVATLAALLGLHEAEPIAAPREFTGWPTWPRVAWQLAVWTGVGGAFWQGIGQPYRADLACAEGEAWLSVERQQALQCYRLATDLDPRREVLWIKWGAAALPVREAPPSESRRQQFRDAQVAFQRAAELGPMNAGTRLALAQVLGELVRQGEGDRIAAFAELNAALELEPRYPVYLSQAGELAMNLGELERAHGYLRSGLDLYPHHVGLCVQGARLAVQQGRYPEAVQLIDAIDSRQFNASEGDHGLWGALSSLAAGYLYLDAPQTALKLAQEVRKQRPSWLAPCFTTARGLEMQGRPGEARREYQHILTVQPTHRVARIRLGELEKALQRR